MSDRLLKESEVIEAVAKYISCDYPSEELAREDAELLVKQIPSAIKIVTNAIDAETIKPMKGADHDILKTDEKNL